MMCHKCGVELIVGENWYPSLQKACNHICKECHNKRCRVWQEANQEKVKLAWTRHNRKRGQIPLSENRECSAFLGVHVAERVLSHVFKEVEVMPYSNPGYDFVCNHGKKIDVKSACVSSQLVDGNKYFRWMFTIERNAIADHFLCIAFDNRTNLNVLHVWLLPGREFNHLKHASISPSTLDKWNVYRIDASKISTCCDMLRSV